MGVHWGNPGRPRSATERAYRRNNIVTIRVAGIQLLVHKELATIFTHLCAALVSEGHVNLSAKKDDWGWANRDVRGSSVLSYHATGQAIDLNALDNPMGPRRTRFPVAKTNALCKKLGLRWGYNYKGRPDAMHFEFTGTIADARRITAQLNKPPVVKAVVAKAKVAVRTVARRKNPYMRPQVSVRPGQYGMAVKWVQWALGLKEDGAYGPVTTSRVRQFQQKHKLTVDGVVGPQTIAKLSEVTR